MQIRLERVKSIGEKIGLKDDKGAAVAIFLALVIISLMLVGYYAFFRPAPDGYNTIYILDGQNNAVNYPQTLVLGQNNTINVPVTVINNMGWTSKYEVLVKVTNSFTSSPVNTQPIQNYTITLKNTKSWQDSVAITENQPGNYWVVFELWQTNGSGSYQFTSDYCVLPIQVVAA